MRFIGAGTEKKRRSGGELEADDCSLRAGSASAIAGPCPSRPLGGMACWTLCLFCCLDQRPVYHPSEASQEISGAARAVPSPAQRYAALRRDTAAAANRSARTPVSPFSGVSHSSAAV